MGVTLLGLFANKKLLDDEVRQWLFDATAWALRNFDARLFREQTVLVLPSDDYFPGRADSVEGMASLIFERVKGYAGMSHWPTRLVDARACQLEPPAAVAITGPLRGEGLPVPEGVAELPVPYDPAMVNNPEAMIGSFAHLLAFNLVQQVGEAPPGGPEALPQASEVLAVLLGFGVILANSSFNVRLPRCGSCGPAPVDRQSFLTEAETTYTLAIFCALKGISASEVVPRLKKSLRGYFKRALKEVNRQGVSVTSLSIRQE